MLSLDTTLEEATMVIGALRAKLAIQPNSEPSLVHLAERALDALSDLGIVLNQMSRVTNQLALDTQVRAVAIELACASVSTQNYQNKSIVAHLIAEETYHRSTGEVASLIAAQADLCAAVLLRHSQEPLLTLQDLARQLHINPAAAK